MIFRTRFSTTPNWFGFFFHGYCCSPTYKWQPTISFFFFTLYCVQFYYTFSFRILFFSIPILFHSLEVTFHRSQRIITGELSVHSFSFSVDIVRIYNISVHMHFWWSCFLRSSPHLICKHINLHWIFFLRFPAFFLQTGFSWKKIAFMQFHKVFTLQ